MSTDKIIVYPRGFIGIDTGLIQTKPDQDDFDQLVKNIKYNRHIQPEKSPFNGNPQVDQLVKDYQTGTKLISSFDFREQIITIALTSFGSYSFYEWCKLQNKSPYFTQMHKRFLNDTFSMLEGNPRSINISTWQSLLSFKEANIADIQSEYLFDDFFRANEAIVCRRSFRLSDNISTWCAQVNGFEDLVMTLNILFGSVE